MKHNRRLNWVDRHWDEIEIAGHFFMMVMILGMGVVGIYLLWGFGY